MRTIFRLFVFSLTITLFAVSARAMEHVPGQLLVQLKKDAHIRDICTDLSKVDGLTTEVHPLKFVSKHMNVWLVQFNPNSIDENEMLYAVHSHVGVVVAQFNHIVSSRATTPNDALFTSQWQYINTGANGGTVDGDIDADEAWDITTGGLTALGDTIVVCALDDGIDLSHPDFGDNRWRNNDEIPNNSIDDDGNGYIDDKEGWSIVTNDDNISGGSHGTPVAGIMGAQGNNGIGVSGVNWDVEVMVLKNNFNTNEAAVLEAYEYPLTMRIMYNNTNGDDGAFVVSTNASWGIDFGQPSSAPLWCAMYDTLGTHGIISCGATINGNQNVDVVGDLPTACPSDFLISVTNCDNTDNKVVNAGYGLITIDLGAHGANAYTTNGSGGYGGFGGTSGATPHVTGAIGLLYSAPCSGLIGLAKVDPALAATKVRQYILNGVDSNTSLQGITSTGGRLNLHKSLQELLNDCPSGSCFAPFAINVNSILDTTARLNWNKVAGVDTVIIQYRINGTTTWTTVADTNLFFDFPGLQACTFYDYRLRSNCDTSANAFTAIKQFQTDGCCKFPDDVQVSLITDSTAMIDWTAVLAANTYTMQLIDTTSGSSISLTNLSTNSQSLSGLQSCTVYEVLLLSSCDTGQTAYSPGVYFKTTGCGSCLDMMYCNSYGDDASLEWISNVTLNTLNNSTGSDGGYGDYTGGPTTDLDRGNNYTISLTPAFSSTLYSEFFRVWIDLNQDGDFDDTGELVYDPGTGTQITIMGTIAIPVNTVLGLTRMRVQMKWDAVGTECEQAFGYGEVEDYCVNIRLSTGLPGNASNNSFNVFPNPSSDQVKIVSVSADDLSNFYYEISDVLGRTILSSKTLHSNEVIDISAFHAGIYHLRISDGANYNQLVKLLVE